MTIVDRMTEIFRTVLDDDELELRDDLTAADVEGWDSLANVNLMFAVEEEFGVRFRDDEFGALADVGDLRRYLEEHAR